MKTSKPTYREVAGQMARMAFYTTVAPLLLALTIAGVIIVLKALGLIV